MAPFLIGVGGAHSGSGKTTVICRLLEAPLKGWGAIKCTPTTLYTSVTDDPGVLGEGDKDTGRYLEAGAGGVVWVRSKVEDLSETMGIAMDRLSHLGGLLVEGNSAVVAVRPDIVIFIAGETGKSKGGSAARLLEMADLVLFDDSAPEEAPRRALCLHRSDIEGIARFVSDALGRKGAVWTKK